jgi:hypothetical protein
VQKSIVTKFQNYINSVSKLAKDKNDDNVRYEVQARLDKLDNAYNEFFRLHNLISQSPDTDQETEDMEHELFEDAFNQRHIGTFIRASSKCSTRNKYWYSITFAKN